MKSESAYSIILEFVQEYFVLHSIKSLFKVYVYAKDIIPSSNDL